MMKRTISGMTGTGSLAHNRRDFFAENVNQNRVYLNIRYRNENVKDVYKELFDESVERYNVGKRNDRKMYEIIMIRSRMESRRSCSMKQFSRLEIIKIWLPGHQREILR